MSDRAGGYPPLADHVDDVLAVMDAVGSTRAALFGVLDGCAIALLTAVNHPDRVAGVVTYATSAVLGAADYPPGLTPEQLATLQTLLNRSLDVDEVLPAWAPSRVGDDGFARWLTRSVRATLNLLPGDDTVLWAGNVDAIAASVESWLKTGMASPAPAEGPRLA